MLGKYKDIRIINLDALTYAGNRENLKDLVGDPRHIFVHGNIYDQELVAGLLADCDPDYVINLAAESHVDRSIVNPEIFVTTNVFGTVNLLQCCRDAWYDAGRKRWRTGKKYVQMLKQLWSAPISGEADSSDDQQCEKSQTAPGLR